MSFPFASASVSIFSLLLFFTEISSSHAASEPLLESFDTIQRSEKIRGDDAKSRKYADVVKFMEAVEKKSPHVAKIFSLGVNDTGQTIKGIALGTGSVQNLVVGTHHGNEYGATELALGLIQSFAESPIQGQTVHIIPVLNVSGYDKRQRREVGQDPNRNYPGPCATEGPFTLRSTKFLADFIANQSIVASATLHTFSPAVLYPWGFSTKDLKTEYDDLFIELGNAAVEESKYEVGNSAAALYPADGTYEDYAFWKHGIWSLLFEVGYSHSPNQDAIDKIIQTNVPGIRRFFEKAPRERAEKHDFTGKCDLRLSGFRIHEE